MVRTSKKRLNDASLEKIFVILFEVLAKNKSKDEFLELVNDIFSPTERIVIAKRVVIMYLLMNKIPQRDIAHALCASIGTVSRYSVVLDGKESRVKKVINDLIKKDRVIDLFDDIFHNLFISPGFLKGHWQIYSDYLRRKGGRKTKGL